MRFRDRETRLYERPGLVETLPVLSGIILNAFYLSKQAIYVATNKVCTSKNTRHNNYFYEHTKVYVPL